MKNTENGQKLKRIAFDTERRLRGKKAIDNAWKSKPSYDQYPIRGQKASLDLHEKVPGLWRRMKSLLSLHIIRASSQEIFRLIFFIMGQTLGVGSVRQAPRLLTTSSQGALFLPQMSIQTDTIVLDNIHTGKSVTIILKNPTNGMSVLK